MDASHLMRRQKSSLLLPFSIIATDIGAGQHNDCERECNLGRSWPTSHTLRWRRAGKY